MTRPRLLLNAFTMDTVTHVSDGSWRRDDTRQTDAGVDGINLQYLVTPGSFADFADHVVPELRRRGPAQHEYAPGTLRHKRSGAGDMLPESHPGRRWHGAFTSVSAEAAGVRWEENSRVPGLRVGDREPG
ncbi:hypothetical protein [Nocardia sp. alder85J]|uniref:hypothetical protein n=1 Tax=Nocardia sp. alder85J TaxID=2862949 RepID=UPI001CD6B0BD|nr:hypothetical protein [Nocardia sp. alder85J]MCX4098538.1 hypothetical protein [Nocardia sp. alder85J]